MSKNLLDGPKEYKKDIDNIDKILYKILDDIKKQTVFLSSHNVESLISKGEIVGDDWEIIENERCDEITFSEGDLNLIELAQTPKTSNKKSKQDTSLFKVRYQYAGAKKGERDFCNKVLESDKVYREEDLNANYNYNEELSPSGTDSYNIFLFKGGVNCKHWWQRVVYLKKGNDRISVNQARKMILELDPKDRKEASFDKNDKRVAKVAEAQNNYWSLTPNYRDSGVELSAKSKELYQRLAGFDPSQTRGADGKWGSEGGPKELTETDVQSIEYYTKNGYKQINGQLISGQNNKPETTRAINRLNEALEKIPNYEGIVYRGDSFDSNNKWFSFLNSIKNKEVFTYKGFMSTSEEKDVTQGFDTIFKGAVIFRINSKTGKSIKDFSDNYNEFEVLFKPNTSFKIDDWDWVNEDRRKKMIVTLTEI